MTISHYWPVTIIPVATILITAILVTAILMTAILVTTIYGSVAALPAKNLTGQKRC